MADESGLFDGRIERNVMWEHKTMDLSRRGFIKLTGAGLAASSLGALGFGEMGPIEGI